MTTSYLFVYGTLRPGFGHPLGHLLARHSDALGTATVSGHVYDLGRYPGLISPAADSTSRVRGELFHLHDPDYLLPVLDDYEGCGPSAQPPTEFIRTLLPVTLADGRTMDAWVYPFNWSPPQHAPIHSGDYLTYLAITEGRLVGHLMQVILYVQEMERSVAFYRDTLGLTISYPANLDSYADQAWVTFSTGEASLCLHSGGSGETPTTAPSFTFRVADIGWSRQALVERGVEMGEIFEAAPGIQICRGKDPDGHSFALEMA